MRVTYGLGSNPNRSCVTADYLVTSLCLGFLICQTGTTTALTSQDAVGIKGNNAFSALCMLLATWRVLKKPSSCFW